MEVGIQAHGRIEHYLKTGEDVLGPMERVGLAYIPKPGEGLLIEQPIDGGLEAAGIPLVGGMDVLDIRGALAVLTDWKFKGDIVAGKTTEAWLRDPYHSDGRQMMAYAEWYRRNRAGDAGSVVVRHVHFQTKRPFKADATSVEVPLEDVRLAWSNVEAYVESMKDTAQTPIVDVEPNRDHCFKYRKPCPYIALCPEGSAKGVAAFGFKGAVPVARAAATQAVQAIQEEDMSMLAQLQKLRGPVTPIPTEAQVAPPPPPAETPHTNQTTSGPPNGAFVTDGPGWKFVECTVCHMPMTALGKRPADASISPDLCPNKASHEAAAQSKPAEAPKETPAPAHAAEPVPSASQAETTKAEPPKDAPKRGRKPKEQTTPAEPARTSGYIAQAVPPVTNYDAGTMLTYKGDGGTKLYFGGAYPVGVAANTLHAYLAQIEAKVLAAAPGITDIRLADHDALKFGKWKAVLASLAKEAPPPPGHYLVTSGDERIEVIGEALAGLAAPGNVIRGGGR